MYEYIVSVCSIISQNRKKKKQAEGFWIYAEHALENLLKNLPSCEGRSLLRPTIISQYIYYTWRFYDFNMQIFVEERFKRRLKGYNWKREEETASDTNSFFIIHSFFARILLVFVQLVFLKSENNLTKYVVP